MKPAAGLSILVAAILVALELLASLSPSRALADELPKDTNQIESLTPEQAKTLLAEFTGRSNYLELSGLTALDAATAKPLAEFKGDFVFLNGLSTLDADTAKALAEFKGQQLRLNGLTALDAGTAKTLAEFKGDYLSLDGLTTLDADTAKALAEFKGQTLQLNGLTTLDADTAKVLAESKSWDGQLPRITAFESPDSVEIATALAKREGPLLLRSLTKISPKTLAALIEKEDVEIPLIETLELIQEPDGSPTEDFVVPKGFQSRQKARQQGR